jgi:hypothetical protein
MVWLAGTPPHRAPPVTTHLATQDTHCPTVTAAEGAAGGGGAAAAAAAAPAPAPLPAAGGGALPGTTALNVNWWQRKQPRKQAGTTRG